MNKWFKLIVISVVVGSLLTACSSSEEATDQKLNVVTTFYPLYELAKQIGGDRVNVTALVPTGIEPHDWAPKVKDMQVIADADLFIYNGAGFEGWVNDFINNHQNSKLVLVEASKNITLIKAEEDHEHHHGEEAVDPHVWTSPLQAQQLAKNIFEGFVQVDSKNKEIYKHNLDKTLSKLNKIHMEYTNLVKQAPKKQIVVSHEAFAYLARDYGIDQHSIMGLSPDSEPTAQDLKSISDSIKKYNVKYILVEKLSSPKLASTLAKDLKVSTLPFHPMEGLTSSEQKANLTYFDLFEKNAETLKKAMQ